MPADSPTSTEEQEVLQKSYLQTHSTGTYLTTDLRKLQDICCSTTYKPQSRWIVP